MTQVATEPVATATSTTGAVVGNDAPAGAAAPQRDVAQVRITDWERREMPASVGRGRETGFQVVVRQSALNTLHRHGVSSPEIEVCGVLIGQVYHDASGPWLYVEYAIEGNHATQRAAQVTFTAETWEHIQSVMDREHPDRRILGWYHTHPGFGIFLSDMDVFIQENFFPEPWQVALVFDPQAKEEGLFVWREGRTTVERFLLEEDAPAEVPTKVVKAPKDVGAGQQGVMGGEVGQFADRLEAIERRQKLIMTLLAVIGLVALAWPLIVGAFLGDLRQQKQAPPPINLPSDDPTSRPMRF
jgi:proteasome lid subunit RPN8/RPN11